MVCGEIVPGARQRKFFQAGHGVARLKLQVVGADVPVVPAHCEQGFGTQFQDF
jgi:hypothetical protein